MIVINKFSEINGNMENFTRKLESILKNQMKILWQKASKISVDVWMAY